MGPMTSLTNMFKNRLIERPVQIDVLRESFINTTSAWVNMLLFPYTGPIRTPVGACATAIEPLDTGFELIAHGKAKVYLAGGFDDLQEDVSFEFANMKATINVENDFACGRVPKDMSRPATSTRSGFVEAQGCGIQVLTSAKLALDIGLPIHGVVALAETANDKIGQSVPAPGKGILTVARGSPTKLLPRCSILDTADGFLRCECVRSSKLKSRNWHTCRSLAMRMDMMALVARPWNMCMKARTNIRSEAQRQEKEALNTYGNNFWRSDTRISPLRGALATWGFTMDDLNVAFNKQG